MFDILVINSSKPEGLPRLPAPAFLAGDWVVSMVIWGQGSLISSQSSVATSKERERYIYIHI